METLIFRPFDPPLPNRMPPGFGPRLGAPTEPKNPENHNAVVGKVWQAYHPSCKLNFIAATLAGRPITDQGKGPRGSRASYEYSRRQLLPTSGFVGGFDGRADQD